MRTSLPLTTEQTRTLKLGGQLSLLALLAGVSAGCSSMGSITGPMFTGSTGNQRDIIASQPAANPNYAQPAAPAYRNYSGPQTAGVQGNDLPPPAGAQSAPAYAAPSAPQPYVPPKAYAAAGMPTPVGPVGQGSRPPGQTLRQLGAPPTTLAAQAERVDGGERASGQRGGASGGVHTVQAGDTMYNIARRNGVSVNELIAANGGSSVARLGTKVVIPGGGSGPKAGVQLASLNPKAAPEPARTSPEVAATPAPVPSAAPPAAPVASSAEILGQSPPQQVAIAPQTGAAAAGAPAVPQAEAESAGFRWPVRGRVISGFGKKADGERNDGINLAVPEGTAVKAAEDGTVIYSGNELKSYGNLVLVRHSNGWVSAYAHNGELKVKRGEQVRRGQIVAASGMSGGVTTPQVHFELRKDATPVDPLQHLKES